jgi:HEAT repeat protein
MVSKRLLVSVFVALVGMPVLAHAGPSAELKEELQGYVDANKESDDLEARQAALMTEGRIGQRAARKSLAEYTDAEEDRVKLGAAMGQWLAGDRGAVNTLVDHLAEDSRLYLTLTDVTSALPDDEQEVLLGRLVKKVDAKQRRDALRYIAEQYGDVYDLLDGYLTGRDDELREAALKAALSTARDEAIGFANKMVSNRREKIRADGFELARGLTRRPGGAPDALDVIARLVDDRSAELAEKAARHLVREGHDKGADRLATFLAEADDDDRRRELAKFLVDHNATVSLEVARPLIDSDDDELTSLGWQLAAKTGDEEVFDELKTMFSSTHFDQRIIAARALGRTGDDQAALILGKALSGGNETLRLHAAKSLADLGSERSLTYLKKAISNERNPEVKIAVVDAISRIDSDQSFNLLRFQTTARNPELKLAVVRGIRRLGRSDGARALRVVHQDRDLAVKWEAALAVIEVDPKAGMQHMKSLLRSPPDHFIADVEALEPSARDAILEHLLVHGDSERRALALSTARRIGEPLFGLFRELVQDADTPANVRRSLLQALAAKSDPQDAGLFEKLVRDADSQDIARLAAWTLASYATEDLEATFRGLLGHDDPAIKSIAAYGLAAIHDK